MLTKRKNLFLPGEDHPAAKLSDAQVADIRTSKDSVKVLAYRHGVSASYIRRLRKGAYRKET